ISNLPDTGYPFLHEYGHVWDRQWLSIGDRQAIIDLYDIPHSWYGGTYNERPAERFADSFSKATMASAGYQVGAGLAFPGPPFTDIGHTSQEMQDAVVWFYNQGITKGTTITTFSPDEPATRGQVALFFYRASGSPQQN
ncbi:MAG: S-layer homology domain-containing protein, partial [Chloroflexi bacterium]|nr:S-layer homology domain-containing protein [Chloroflexota bacterium]